MAAHATQPVPEPDGTELDWEDFFAELDPGLVFECSSTRAGQFDSVFVYRHRVVIDSALEEGSAVEVPLSRIRGWYIDHGADTGHLTLAASHTHVARIPLPFARALERALREVLGTDPARLAA